VSGPVQIRSVACGYVPVSVVVVVVAAPSTSGVTFDAVTLAVSLIASGWVAVTTIVVVALLPAPRETLSAGRAAARADAGSPRNSCRGRYG
jgi:hypothetical protein